MREDKLKKIIPFIAVVLLFVLIKSGLFSGKRGKLPDIQNRYNVSPLQGFIKKGNGESVSAKDLEVNKLDLEGISWRKDIFAPSVNKDVTEKDSGKEITGRDVKDLQITGWAQKGRDTIVVINDRLLRIGDDIAGKKIILIEKNKVVLEDKAGVNYVVTYAREKAAEDER